MRKLILPAVLAAVVGLAFLPSHAQASWLSEAIHQARGDYNPGYYDYAPGYGYAPDYSYYSPGYYDNAPPVYYYTPPSIYVAPTYNPYGYSGYQFNDYRPRYHDEWRGHDEHGEHHERQEHHEDRGHDHHR